MLANQLSPQDTRPPSKDCLYARFKIAIVIFFHFIIHVWRLLWKNNWLFLLGLHYFIFIECIIFVLIFNDGTTYTWPHLSEVSLITKRFSSHIKSKYSSNVMVSSMSLIFDTSNMNISTKISNGPSVVGIMSWNNTINKCDVCVCDPPIQFQNSFYRIFYNQ